MKITVFGVYVKQFSLCARNSPKWNQRIEDRNGMQSENKSVSSKETLNFGRNGNGRNEK